ncbi:MAG: formylglycine-generating enzyme family protein [Deltaproteobacteria bacterium]|nr:formylglycine-generating enzyme family protein [Deltaproteobacteria bacterium]
MKRNAMTDLDAKRPQGSKGPNPMTGRFALLKWLAVLLFWSLVMQSSSCRLPNEPPKPPAHVYPPSVRTDLPRFTNSLGMEFVKLPPGTFTMGSSTEDEDRQGGETLHEVTLTKGFFLQVTEVTQGQWLQVMQTFPSSFTTCGYECPVENISWFLMQEFIDRLNSMDTSKKYRLPTEAEWEYAARAGTKTAFAYGDCLDTRLANFDGRYPVKDCHRGIYLQRTVPVRTYPPNAWGLHEMHGNVAEACQDWYDELPEAPVKDPEGAETGIRRVFRGGSWSNDAKYCRSATRGKYEPDSPSQLRGFRLAADDK